MSSLAVLKGSMGERKSVLVNRWRGCHHFHGNKPVEVFGISSWVSWGEAVSNSQPSEICTKVLKKMCHDRVSRQTVGVGQVVQYSPDPRWAPERQYFGLSVLLRGGLQGRVGVRY